MLHSRIVIIWCINEKPVTWQNFYNLDSNLRRCRRSQTIENSSSFLRWFCRRRFRSERICLRRTQSLRDTLEKYDNVCTRLSVLVMNFRCLSVIFRIAHLNFDIVYLRFLLKAILSSYVTKCIKIWVSHLIQFWLVC